MTKCKLKYLHINVTFIKKSSKMSSIGELKSILEAGGDPNQLIGVHH